jgi:hypothetical protein
MVRDVLREGTFEGRHTLKYKKVYNWDSYYL